MYGSMNSVDFCYGNFPGVLFFFLDVPQLGMVG